MRSSRVLIAALAVAVLLPTLGASAQKKVVVSHDEWLTNGPDNGTLEFNSNEQQFVGNALDWFGIHTGANVLIYTNDPYITNHSFTDWLGLRGYNVSMTATPITLSGYDVIFGEGNPSFDGAALASYVMNGGNVMYMGGTGVGGDVAEAACSNTFLNAFGLAFAGAYNGLNTVSTVGFDSQNPFGPALFTGVSSVFANNGQDISRFDVANVTSQVFYDERQNGVFAAAQVTATPEPMSLTLLGTGLVGVFGAARRRRRRPLA
jgi:MYXO-CTERM domain-containing protein